MALAKRLWSDATGPHVAHPPGVHPGELNKVRGISKEPGLERELEGAVPQPPFTRRGTVWRGPTPGLRSRALSCGSSRLAARGMTAWENGRGDRTHRGAKDDCCGPGGHLRVIDRILGVT